MTYGVYDIKDQYKGDTFNGVQFTLVDYTNDNTPIDLTDTVIKTKFRKNSEKGQEVKEIVTGDGITIVDAVNGVFKFDAFILNFQSAIYYYDVEVTFLNGVVKTYVKGTMNVLQDVTY